MTSKEHLERKLIQAKTTLRQREARLSSAQMEANHIRSLVKSSVASVESIEEQIVTVQDNEAEAAQTKSSEETQGSEA